MMKKLTYIIVGLIGLSTIVSCEKNAVQILPAVEIESQIKFFNFAPSSPSVNFFANTNKISGTLTSSGIVSTTGVTYGNVFPANNYASVTAGSYDIKGQISETATVDANLAIANLNVTLEKGKYYSFYSSGIYNTTAKTAESFIINDELPAVDTSFAYVRFVNAISNSNPLTFVVSNTSTSTEQVIGNSIVYKSGSAFVKVPEAVYNLFGRNIGSSTNAISRTSVSFLKGRIYTISGRGNITITSTTEATRPIFDNTFNR